MACLNEVLSEVGVGSSVKLKVLHKNDGRETYLVSGELPWGTDVAVLKMVSDKFSNEIRFYGEPGLLNNYRPDIYFVDSDRCFVFMEYVNQCGIWNNKTFNHAIDVVSGMHSVGWDCNDIPEWIPKIGPVTNKQMQYFYSAISKNMECLIPYAGILEKGAEKVKTLFPQVCESPFTLIHGDLMYVNMGVGPKGLVLFDWSGVKFAPAAYELCYPVEQFNEVFANRTIDVDKAILHYIAGLKRKDIFIDLSQFKHDYAISYLHRCLFLYIPDYINKGMISVLMRKVPIVCKMIKGLQ